MLKRITFMLLLLLTALLSGCGSQEADSAELEQVQERLIVAEARLDALSQGGDTSALEARIAALEAQIETLSTASGEMMTDHAEGTAEGSMEMADMDHAAEAGTTDLQNQVFQVTMATYLLDTVDFHAMDERLNEEGTILPGDAGLVKRVQRTLAVTDWPKGLKPKADHLAGILENYAEALADDDLEAAKSLAAETHTAQHDLSQVVATWLVGVSGVVGDDEAAHVHNETGAHLDHSPHHGGLVSMAGNLHLELVAKETGEYQVYLTDAFRQPLDPTGVTGSLVLMPGMEQEMVLPLQVMQDEYLATSGDPTDNEAMAGMAEMAGMKVSVRLEGTSEGAVEVTFTLGDENGYDHEDGHDHEEGQGD